MVVDPGWVGICSDGTRTLMGDLMNGVHIKYVQLVKVDCLA